MSNNLCDETFPTSLLIEFDELDDEIPISPELPKRHQPESFLRARTTLSGDKGSVTDKINVDRSGSRMVISGSSNTSSGHSSLSTEGENRSASSDRDTSRDLGKRQSLDVGPGALLLLGEQRTDKSTLKSRKTREPRSMESLLQHPGRKTASPLHSGTGLSMGGKGLGGGSTGNVSSVSSIGASNQQQQHYRRQRSKYGHVQSKVKQMIDEMKPPTNRDRKTLVRHKSMPETSHDVEPKDEVLEYATLEPENDVETLRTVVREMRLHMGSMEQQLTICRTNMFNELATLKCKNDALRLENDHLHEQERAREQRRQLLREKQATAGSCYGSQSSLCKASVGSTCTVGTQTSPSRTGDGADHEDQFEFLLASPPTLARPALPPQTTSSTIEPPESVECEFSPDYQQLLPMLGHSGGSSAFGANIRHRALRRTPSIRSPAGRRSELGQAQDCTTSPTCHDCRRRKKKRKSRKQKLASFFCIRHHDESL
uniref:Uncharacterized protein n=1 Tax=Anopheles minimus TaxID=112268 RepID=A0A182W1T6_9DIPT